MTPLLSIAEVSKLLNVNHITVRRLVAEGKLPAIRLTPGGRLRFDLRDLEKFVEKHKS